MGYKQRKGNEILKAPFIFFGGKSRIASVVWEALGNVAHYIEPFFGSGAVFLSRPHPHSLSTVNDADGFIANVWRSLQHAPDETAEWAAYPVSEVDLAARHVWLLDRKAGLPERLMADPDYYDAQIAGWWLWGINSWIGSGWCSGEGPWRNVDGVFTHVGSGKGVSRQLPHLSHAGRGVNRKLPHLSDAGTGDFMGERKAWLREWFHALANPLATARVCCGDWSRVCGPSVLWAGGTVCGVFLDPPYSAEAGRNSSLYACESLTVAHEVRRWCLENGDHPRLRIVLAGYAGEGHEELEAHGWKVHAWSAHGGYSNQSGSDNRHKERLWLSPHCLGVKKKAQHNWLEELLC